MIRLCPKPLMRLLELWEKHVLDRGHDLGAKFNMNLAWTYITCCAKGCNWSHTTKRN